MLDFNLLPGDKYDGRCAEIYITEKQFLIYHCSVCEEIYTTFNELLSHITKGHYENTKELSQVDMRKVETVKKQETENQNQYETNNLYVAAKEYTDGYETKTPLLKTVEDRSFKQSFTVEVKIPLKEMSPLLHSSKGLSQRKKYGSATSSLKSNNIGKTKLNTLTRHQANSNDELKYVCAICGFAFKEKHNLRGHLLRHSNQKHLSCFLCSKKFFTKMELRLHENRHKSERSYVCEQCGMGFISLASLTQHLRKHHYHPLKCDQCFRLFSNLPPNKDEKIQCSDVYTEKSLSVCSYKKMLEKTTSEAVGNKKITNTQDKKVNLKKKTVEESDFCLDENFDEYELVQTLSDLRCIKYV